MARKRITAADFRDDLRLTSNLEIREFALFDESVRTFSESGLEVPDIRGAKFIRYELSQLLG
jgi:hypothetical protein